MSSYKNFLSERLQTSKFIYLFENAIRSGFSGKSFYNKLIKPILESNKLKSLTSLNEVIEKKLIETVEMPDLNFSKLSAPTPRVRDELKTLIYKELEWVLDEIYKTIKSSESNLKTAAKGRNEILTISLFKYLLPQIQKYFSQIKPEIRFKDDKSAEEIRKLKSDIESKRKLDDDSVAKQMMKRTFVSTPKPLEPMSQVAKSDNMSQFKERISKATNKFEIAAIIRDAEEFIYNKNGNIETLTDKQIEELNDMARKQLSGERTVVNPEPITARSRSRSGRSGSQVKKDVEKFTPEEKDYYNSLGNNSTLKGKFIRANPEERRRMMGLSTKPVQRELFSTNENFKLKNLTFKSFFDYIN